MPHNHPMVAAPAKREIAEDPPQLRIAYLPIFEPKVEDPADPNRIRRVLSQIATICLWLITIYWWLTTKI
jgi:hypothetical protein